MLKHLENHRTLIAILLILIILATFLFAPTFMQLTSMIILFVSIGMAVVLISQKHWRSYHEAECTREKMSRNLSLDLLGLLLTMGAAMYVGRLAGTYIGLHTGFWLGLIAGFVGGFLAARVVRSAWGRIIKVAN